MSSSFDRIFKQKEDLKDKKLDLYKLFYPEKWGREQQEYGSFNSIQIASIFKHLEEVKVVDPACGSWAFWCEWCKWYLM